MNVLKKAPPASKRNQRDSSDEPSSDEGDDKAAMLAALQAYSRALLGLDGPEEAESSKQGRRRLSSPGSDEASDEDEEHGEGSEGDTEEFSSDDGWGEGDDLVTDSEEEEMAVLPSSIRKPAVPEVVFAPSSSTANTAISSSEKRAFLVSPSERVLLG